MVQFGLMVHRVVLHCLLITPCMVHMDPKCIRECTRECTWECNTVPGDLWDLKLEVCTHLLA